MPAGTYNSAHPTHGSYFAGPGSLVVAGSSPQGFEAWAQAEGLSGQDALPSADPDGDGVANLLEYILGGKALQPDAAAILPTREIANGFLTLRYRRSQASLTDTLQTGQWSTDLLTWTDIEPILVQNNSPEPDAMEIRIPLSLATQGKLFARLQALPKP
jgi:hypothetical protein